MIFSGHFSAFISDFNPNRHQEKKKWGGGKRKNSLVKQSNVVGAAVLEPCRIFFPGGGKRFSWRDTIGVVHVLLYINDG